MAQVSLLVTELKRYLKSHGITYAVLGKQLGLSESSVKRLFARQSFSLQRLEQILNLLGLEIADLVALMNERREFLTELTPEQEDALLADPKQLLMTYLLVNGWPLAEITNTFAIDDAEAERVLIRLHRARIIELLPFNRVKLLTARNFTWRKNGPVQAFFRREVQREFLDSSFAGPAEHLRFVAGLAVARQPRAAAAIDRALGTRVRRARAPRCDVAARRAPQLQRRVRAAPVGVLDVRGAAPQAAARRWIAQHSR